MYQFSFMYGKIYKFDQSHVINFANIETTYLANSIKVAFRIQNWPFLSLSNTLAITMDSGSNNEVDSCVNGGTDEAGNMRWFMLYVGDVALYLFFLKVYYSF